MYPSISPRPFFLRTLMHSAGFYRRMVSSHLCPRNTVPAWWSGEGFQRTLGHTSLWCGAPRGTLLWSITIEWQCQAQNNFCHLWSCSCHHYWSFSCYSPDKAHWPVDTGAPALLFCQCWSSKYQLFPHWQTWTLYKCFPLFGNQFST